ncbi:MBL fold metallo-hydrolase [Cohnella cholangitidis]|uniref:MBL fold metallo-hydrolase n=2 Tax=Cohnella cholangitidis TaxID=2598458 RepID=A0A7G5C6H8_9BACL|nr:MBL fold metallo-hydrolase [Cohnella cholangitidis]QMV44812.1 MBL fold metallo-hydrolase [Cohnella cholangitidis]
MSYGSDYHYLPITSIQSGAGHEATPELFGLTVQIVNVYFVGIPEKKEWVLVDAGMPKAADDIISAAEERFGTGTPPKAIVLTHGHFDHVGSVIELINHWNAPVYAHHEEIPYLTGLQAYLPPDPSVEGGLIAKMSSWFPNEPIDLGSRIQMLPSDGTIPFMPGWKWIHTGGHTPGHVSFFNENNRSLIAGDAFVTVKQESVYKVFTQEPEISGPPKYFTTDWTSARQSVIKLEALKPAIAVTGHGMPMSGQTLSKNLRRLVSDFDSIAMPSEGKYV